MHAAVEDSNHAGTRADTSPASAKPGRSSPRKRQHGAPPHRGRRGDDGRAVYFLI
jgi:hypothetical protein